MSRDALQRCVFQRCVWSDCLVPDLKLLLWLDEQLRAVPEDQHWDFGGVDPASVILGDYQFAFAQSATPKERESVLSFVEIWCAALKDFAPERVELIAPLEKIATALRAMQ